MKNAIVKTGLTVVLGLMLILGISAPAFASSWVLPGDGSIGGAPNSVVMYNNILYGTGYGGGTGSGTIYSLDPSTGTFTNLVNFGEDLAGAGPIDSLTLDATNGILYGTTSMAGLNGKGTVFSYNINTLASSATSFTGANGNLSKGSLAYDSVNNLLYGVAQAGGVNNAGTLFSYNPETLAITRLYSFANATGAAPMGYLTLDGTTLYGTVSGGSNGPGGVFTYNLGTSTYNEIYAMQGGTTGANPTDGVILYNGKLYGTAVNTTAGSGNGVIYSLNTDGTGYTVLHSFAGATDDGADPVKSLVLDTETGTLYGVTGIGGADNLGTLFSLNINGSGYTVWESFDATANTPVARLYLDSTNHVLYGALAAGGAGSGVIFSQSLTPEPATMISGLLALLGFGIKRFRLRKQEA
ncbi:MAG: choice-of-anchor tandem repeat GloVer-containing protein [Candidatus Omnitrophota bacterium]